MSVINTNTGCAAMFVITGLAFGFGIFAIGGQWGLVFGGVVTFGALILLELNHDSDRGAP